MLEPVRYACLACAVPSFAVAALTQKISRPGERSFYVCRAEHVHTMFNYWNNTSVRLA